MLANDLPWILLYRQHLRLKAHAALDMLVRDLVEIPLVHDPLRTRPLCILRVLNVGHLAVGAKELQTDARQTLPLCIVGTRIHKALDFPVIDLLDDQMLLRLHAGVALDLVVDDIAVRRIRTRYNIFIEKNCAYAHDEAEENRRSRNPSKADAAGLHRRDLTR